MKTLFRVVILLMVVSAVAFAQATRYTFVKNFPNDAYRTPGLNGGHGVAVDPEGKVWFQAYDVSDSVLVASTGKYAKTRAIYCWKPDGTPAAFSPIKTVTVGTVTDTLYNSSRGMRADANGNVVFCSFDTYYRLNYKTGAGMKKIVANFNNTGIQPAFDSFNEMFTGLVIPKGPIKMHDNTGAFLGNVVDSADGFARSIEVSADGNDVFWAGFTNNAVYKYHSDNGSLGPYSKLDTVMKGLSVESITRHLKTGAYWASGGSLGSVDNGYRNYKWYAFAPTNLNSPIDSLAWAGLVSGDPRPRGMAFSPSGDTVYVVEFGTNTVCPIQMFVKQAATSANLPTVIVSTATSVSSTAATLNGSVNPNGLATTAWFEWGTISTLSSFSTTASQSVGSGTSATPVTANLTGLSPSTTYYYRAVGQNSAGTQKASILSFTTVALAVPTITSLSPTSGPVGTSVTITGTNFSTTAANNIVYFGAAKATVTSATSTSLSVTVPTGATYQPITVTVDGLTAYSRAPFIVTFPGGGSITSTSLAGKVDFTTGTRPQIVAIGDIDGDGKPDLAIANAGSYTVSVFRNSSSSGSITASSFASKVDFTTGTGPYSIAIGDLDGDGKPDLAIANAGSYTVSVFRNTSSSGSITASSFASKVDFTTGTVPYSIAIGDLDGDGKPDLVLANEASNTVSVFRNTSASGSITASSFASKMDFTTGGGPFSVAIGDVDGDGKRDLVVANSGSNTVSVLRNTSTSGSITASSFASKVDFTTGAFTISVAIGDLDGDGKPDLVVANSNSYTVSVLRNTSTSGSITASSFSSKVDFTTGVNPYSIAIGDIAGDGKPDLAAANYGSNTVSVFRNTSASGSITASSFAAKVDFTTGSNPYGVAIGDVDGDGKPDLVVTNNGSTTISVFRSTVTTGSSPTVTTSAATSVISSSATMNGSVNPNGSSTIAYFEWGMSSTLSTSTSTTSQSIGSGTSAVSVTANVTGLSSITTYYFRVVGQNSAGTQRGNIVSFTTAADAPRSLCVSMSGSDANAGTASAPFRNIQTALTRASKEDTVKVEAGIYAENLTTLVKVVLRGGYSGSFSEVERTFIENKSVLRTTAGTALSDGLSSTIDGFVVDGTAGANKGIVVTAGHAIVTHNVVYGISRSGGSCIEIAAAASATIMNNTVANNKLSGGGVIIYSIYVRGNADRTTVVMNNLAYGNSVGISIGSTLGVSAGYNCSYINTYYNFDGAAAGPTDFSKDPIFRNSSANDFRLSSNSPCIDAGDPFSPLDPDGTRSDIGAYYFPSVISIPPAPSLSSPSHGSTSQATTMTITWGASAGATKYHLQVSTSVGFSSFVVDDSALAGTSRSIGPLTDSTTHYWRVRAGNSAGWSSFSASWTFTTVVGTPSPTTDLVHVTGGTFTMGSNAANDYGASPPHSVTLGAFYLDKTETTYERWTNVRTWGSTHGYTDLPVGRNGFSGTTDHPVTEVSWYDILKWCNARSEKDGATPVYYMSNTLSTVYRTGQLDLAADAVKWTANGYRLLTEAEWEFAARGGTKSQGYTYSGSNTLYGVAWNGVNSGSNTHPVSTKEANELGLYDMSGNVWEWCWDWYGAYSSTAQTDPKGPTTSSSIRVLRGGSFINPDNSCRVADRSFNDLPLSRVYNYGFRCVQTDTASIVQNQPTVVTTAASSVSSNSAILNGSVNPNGLSTTASFEWGTIATLSPSSTTPSQSIGSGMYAVALTANLTGLSQGTTYYFRVVGQNSFVTQRGSIVSFTPVAAVPTIAVSASSLTFGTVSTGTSAQKTFTVSNSGTATLNVSNITSNDAAFAAIPGSFFIASGGGAQTVTVTFTPAAARTYGATLSVTHDASGSPSLISLTGTGTGSAVISLPQSSHAFGTRSLGSSTSQTLTVTNSGNVALTVTNITSSNSSFAVSPTSFTLSPGASQTLTVTFTPTGGGALSSSLVFVSNAASSPTFTLSGTGDTRLSGSSTQAGRFSGGIPPSTWVLMSIPYNLDNAAAGILSSQLSGQNPWVMYTYQNGQMIDYSQQNNAFMVTRGLWFKTIVKSSSFNLDFGPGDLIGGSSYPVTVSTGWSLVGPPFHSEEASWTPVNTTAGSVGIRVYQYVHEATAGWQLLNPSVERMKPFGGYAVYNGTGAPATFTFVRGGPLSSYHEWQAGDGWYGVLAIGETRLRIGQHRMASAGEDGLDYPMPPPRPEADETPAHFPGNLWSDIRPTGSSEVLSWKVVIDPRTASSIKFTDRMDIPEGFRIVVQGIPYLGPVDMTSKDSIALPTTLQGVYTVTVLAGSAEAIAEKIMPREPMILQNYPNPFNPTTSIRYQIANESAVSLRIFNSLGEEITTLVNGPHRPGFYDVQWDGRDARGSSVSSGIYYCVLRAGGYVAAAKVVLLK